jgi:hypothetical protein
VRFGIVSLGQIEPMALPARTHQALPC